MRTRLPLLFFLAAVVAAGPSLAQEYEIIDLGPDPGTESSGAAINDAGRVAGTVGRVGYGGQAMFTDGAGMTDLGFLLGSPWASMAWDVAPDGTIVGWRQASQTGVREAFATDGATVQYLAPLSPGWNAQVNGVNGGGTMVGASFDPVTWAQRAVRWDPGSSTPVDLGIWLGAGTSTAEDINEAGDICGQIHPNPYLLSGGTVTILPLLSGGDGGAKALNDSGMAVGTASSHPVRWEGGAVYDLALPSWIRGDAYDVNDLDMVVGAGLGNLDYEAFLWTRGGGTVRLEDLAASMGGFSSLTFAYGINERGEITGEGRVGTTDHAFLARPLLSLLPPAPGAAGVVNRFTAIGATPGATLYFAYGLVQGSTPVPPCPGVYVDLANPHLFHTGTANGNGVVDFEMLVPSGAAGLTVSLQVVEPATCRVSKLVVQQF